MNGLLKTADALQILNVTKKTLFKYIHTGQLKAYKLPNNRYRIRRADLDAFIGAGGELRETHSTRIENSSAQAAPPAPTSKGD